MLELLSPRTRRQRPGVRTTRLRLEALEVRENPSTVTLDVAYGEGVNVTLSGTLSGEGYQLVEFSGAVMGSVWTDATGSYQATYMAMGEGDVFARAMDGMSNTANFTLTGLNDPSTITLDVVYGEGLNVTLSGTLSGGGYQLVEFSGAVMGSVWTDANGHYQVTYMAMGLGDIFARAMDGTSNTASFTLTDMAPQLLSFSAVEGTDNVWTFSGTFTYFRYWESMTVMIYGVPMTISTAGQSTQGTANGYFELVRTLCGTQNDNGTVWAKVLSPFGTVSNVIYDSVSQTGV
jgi:hypothetical protein